MKGIQLWFARNNGALFALVLFVAMFAIYVVKNGVGLRIGLVTAVANKGVLLALVAMAQTLPILTSGLDLSVGAIFVLTNCIASIILSGPPWMVAAGIYRRTPQRRRLWRNKRSSRRLWTAAAHHRDARNRRRV